MTNVVNQHVAHGIKEKAASVVKKCEASSGTYLDVYVQRPCLQSLKIIANILKVTLHCYALDCASHFLFNPVGTNTLDNPEDLKLMQELSYHDSLKRT